MAAPKGNRHIELLETKTKYVAGRVASVPSHWVLVTAVGALH